MVSFTSNIGNDITSQVSFPDEAKIIATHYNEFFNKYGFGICGFVAQAVKNVYGYRPVLCYLSNSDVEEHFINIDNNNRLLDFTGLIFKNSEYNRYKEPITIMNDIPSINPKDERVLFFERLLKRY